MMKGCDVWILQGRSILGCDHSDNHRCVSISKVKLMNRNRYKVV